MPVIPCTGSTTPIPLIYSTCAEGLKDRKVLILLEYSALLTERVRPYNIYIYTLSYLSIYLLIINIFSYRRYFWSQQHI